MKQRVSVVAAALALLVACARTAPPVVSPGGTPGAPAQSQPTAPAAETRRYVIDGAHSEVRFIVGRAGALARLGHDHVIRARTIVGEVNVARDASASSFTLELPVADFEVDPPGARAEEGPAFTALPDADAIAGTRRNMLGEHVLDAARFPVVRVQSLGMTGPAWLPDLTLRIDLHGVERRLVVPVSIEHGPDRLTASASFEIKQSDFGITPLSVLGGALQVADVVRVRVRLVVVATAPR